MAEMTTGETDEPRLMAALNERLRPFINRPLTEDQRDEVSGAIAEYIRTLPSPPPPIEVIGHHFKRDGTLVIHIKDHRL